MSFKDHLSQSDFLYSVRSAIWFAHYRPEWDISKPISIVIEPTRRCNLACCYCPHNQLVASKTLAPIEMTDSVFEKLLQQLSNYYSQFFPLNVSFQGLGEPLLDSNLLRRIKKIKETFKHAMISVNTNGILLNNSLINKFEGLLVSLNFSNAKSYLKYNKVDAYDKVVANICRFLAAKGNAFPRTTIQLLKLKDNDPVKFRAFWESKISSIDSLHLHDMNSWTGNLSEFKLIAPQSPRHPCRQLWEKLYISAEGNVYPCCLGEVAGDLKLGNILDLPISEIWASAKLNSLRKLHQNSQYSRIDSCSSCLVWKEVAIPMLKLGKRWL
ncbi:MAG: radical SAM/SPASM domain-containing protein [Candidatus Bathyarchaeia archaeon]